MFLDRELRICTDTSMSRTAGLMVDASFAGVFALAFGLVSSPAALSDIGAIGRRPFNDGCPRLARSGLEVCVFEE